jgi:hypothetical protein
MRTIWVRVLHFENIRTIAVPLSEWRSHETRVVRVQLPDESNASRTSVEKLELAADSGETRR